MTFEHANDAIHHPIENIREVGTRLVPDDRRTLRILLPSDAPTPSDDLAWMDAALCKGRTELFFGTNRERPERREKRELLARKFCLVCPALEPCRTMARNNGENGFWGGESEEERAAAGFAPRSISRRGVQAAARQASARIGSESDEWLASKPA